MDALGSVATVVQLVSFTGDLLVRGYGYLAKVRKAPAEIRALMRETATLNSLLAQLQDQVVEAEYDGTANHALQTLEMLGTFEDCETLMRLIESGIKTCEQVDGERLRNLGKQIVWPFKGNEMKELKEQLRLLIDTFDSAVTLDSSRTLKNVKTIVNSIDRNVIENLAFVADIKANSHSTAEAVVHVKAVLETSFKEQEKIAIRKWLHPDAIESDAQYNAALKQRERGTGTWLLNSSNFQKWRIDKASCCIWLYGIAGCGKTVLAATVIAYLREISEDDSHILFFFCDHRNPNKKSITDLLHVTIKQLLDRDSSCFGDAKAWYDKKFSGSQGVAKPLTDPEYRELVRRLCSKWSTVYLVVDAVDECSDLESFVEGIKKLTDSSNIKTLLTGRYEIDLMRTISHIVSYEVAVTDHMGEDIDIFLTTEIDRKLATGSLKLRSQDLRSELLSNLNQKANGMILLAKLHLDYICGLRSDRAIREAMIRLPSSVYEIYDEILRQLCSKRPDDIEDIRYILQWRVFCEVPLGLQQVAEIVSIRVGDRLLDKSGIATDILDLAACLGSFVTLHIENTSANFYADLRGTELIIITLSHYSVEEYLKSGQMDTELAVKFPMNPYEVHLQCAKRCLQYIGFDDFNHPIEQPDISFGHNLQAERRLLRLRTSKYEFYDYACRYWADHWCKSGCEKRLDEELIALLSWFICPSDYLGKYQSWQQMYHHDVVYYCPGRPPLYYAIEFRLDVLAAVLLPDKNNINVSLYGMTALHVAARCGSLYMIEKLLELGAEVDIRTAKDPYGLTSLMTPLHYAAEGGHIRAIKLLLKYGASPHSKNESGSTPFLRAARSGSLGAMKILRDAGCEIDPVAKGHTPLFEAMVHCRPRVACQLLYWGADPGKISNRFGQSTLAILARNAIKSNGICGGNGPPREELLQEIETLRRHGGGPEAFEHLFKGLQLYWTLTKQMAKDTRPGTEREKDYRWVMDSSRIVTRAEFRDRIFEPYFL